jgi:hypothetical protein
MLIIKPVINTTITFVKDFHLQKAVLTKPYNKRIDVKYIKFIQWTTEYRKNYKSVHEAMHKFIICI